MTEELVVEPTVEPERKIALTLSDRIQEELKKGAEGNIRQFAKKNCRQCNSKGIMTLYMLKHDEKFKVKRVCDCIIRLMKKDIQQRHMRVKRVEEKT